jgi:hypothetical protein
MGVDSGVEVDVSHRYIQIFDGLQVRAWSADTNEYLYRDNGLRTPGLNGR